MSVPVQPKVLPDVLRCEKRYEGLVLQYPAIDGVDALRLPHGALAQQVVACTSWKPLTEAYSECLCRDGAMNYSSEPCHSHPGKVRQCH